MSVIKWWNGLNPDKKYKFIITVLMCIIFVLLWKFVDSIDSPIRKGFLSAEDYSSGTVSENEFIAFCNSNVVVNDNTANILVENNEKNQTLRCIG